MLPTTLPSASSRYNNAEWRNVFPLPLSDKFFDMLQDQLHAVCENILFHGDTRFTLFINAVNRKEHKRYLRDQSPDFIYAGLKRQKEILDRNAKQRWGKPPQDTEKIRKAWRQLGDTEIVQENSEISSSYYKEIKEGLLDLDGTCRIHRLKDYFNKKTKYSKEQLSEKIIINNYFDIEKDAFISAPLFGFAEFDAVVHIIFKDDLLSAVFADKERKQINKRLMWVVLRAFIMEYDGLFLDWDMIGDNIEKISAIHEFVTYTIMNSDEHFGRVTGGGKTKLIADLKLQEYYIQHRPYFIARLDAGEEVPGKIYNQYITHAVSSILVDSYAHNVSAHALSTLAWWYYRRYKMLRDEEVDWDALLRFLKKDRFIDKDLITRFQGTIEDRREKREEWNRANNLTSVIDVPKEAIRVEDGEKVIRYPGSLARELAQLLRFLTEKGAYWSGVARDNSVGGKVSTLYSILWYDFINNPFYVGTIAKTEDILKINLRIILYDPEPAGRRSNNTFYHDKTFKPENNIIFATVDLSDPRPDFTTELAKSHESVLSAFVKKGKDFEQFKNKLKDIKIFFPGGIVGRHAFFTMIENEIRNVKHYNHEELKTLQEEGLTVALGVQACSMHNTSNKEIYRMSIWLETPTRLGKGENHLMLRKWRMLKGDIINPETRAPNLGGSYQDKVCAGFLLNGFFSHVQRGDKNPNRDKREDTGRDLNYFPWVRPACSAIPDPETNCHRDYKISFNNPLIEIKIPDPNDPLSIRTEMQPQVAADVPSTGYSKKIFYLWRGDNLVDWSTAKSGQKIEASWDNPARFTIVNLENQELGIMQELRRERGIVRIVKGVEKDLDEDTRFTAAYIKWLNILLDNNGSDVYPIVVGEGTVPHYWFVLNGQPHAPKFYHHYESAGAPYEPILVEGRISSKNNFLKVVHKSDSVALRSDEIRYRNHGIYKTYFFPDSFDAFIEEHKTHRMLELFEVFVTKVCIFDNRVQHRLRIGQEQKIEVDNDSYKTMLRDNLKLGIYNEALEAEAVDREEMPAWLAKLDAADRDFVLNCHFLVLHLSFIERILGQAHADTGNVGFFIDKYIIPYFGNRDNFFLVITTGRGRNEWWNSIAQGEYKEKGYAKFVLFRPIESLLAVVENSVNMQDDIELKYRVTKVLYGS